MHRVEGVPLLGIALAIALGIISLAYVCVAGVHAHRRELAILRALGLDMKGTRRVLVWHGVLIATVTVVIGVKSDSVVPVAFLLTIPGAVVVAVSASLLAGLRTRLSMVADVLRSE